MTEPRPAAPGALSGSPLLEREQELSALDELLSAAAQSGPRLVLVEGSAGIGKSRLIAELRAHARAKGVTVLAAHGSDLEREFPFGVVRQLFEPLLVAAAERERLLVDAAAAAGPVFENVHPDAAGGGDASFAALHGLYWLTVNVAADRPLLLAVDDLQWCDRPSLRFLAYLARRLEGSEVVLTAGLRTGERGTDPVLIGELADAPGTLRVQPGPLSEAGVGELIACRLGSPPEPAFTEACLTATGGNPLLLGQLLSSLHADGVMPAATQVDAVRKVGPGAVARTVLRRLHGLPAEAATVAQAVAVLGDGARLPLVASLAGLDEDAAAGAAAALARVDILRQEPPLGFVHPLVRDAVYHDLPALERELRHGRAARLLLDAEASAEEVATQLLGSPRRAEEWVVDVLADAAESARARGAADSAVAYLERALQEPPPAERRGVILLQLGIAETFTHGPAAADHLGEAWEALEEPHERARVATTLARTLIFTAPAEDAVAFAKRAGAEVPPDLVDERQALRAIELYAVPLGTGDVDAAALLRDVRIDGDGPGAKMLAAAAALGLTLTGAAADECVTLAEEALAGGVLIDADHGILATGAAWVLMMADRDEAFAVWDEMSAQAHRRGSLFGFLGSHLGSGAALLWRGDLPEAESRLVSALENAAAWGLLREKGFYGPALAFTGATRVLRGDLEGARRLLDSPEVAARRADTSRLALSSRVDLLLAEGRHDEALEAADDLADRWGAIVNPWWAPWRSQKAVALERMGRTDEALDLLREELAHARRFGAPSAVGRTLRLLGTLEREQGVERLRESVELLERSTAKLELAFALLALGSALRRGRTPTEARGPLGRALELAGRYDAIPLAEQARTELYAAGGRPRRTALAGAESLTASERRVAELAAEGRTNKEIAQSLFVTLKTVELHLSHAYRKLGIRTRHGLSAALGARPQGG
jgi:DNA-binding CsgD family transcriptional regulator